MLYFDFANPYIIYAVFVLFTAFSIQVVFRKKEFFIKHKKTVYIIATVLMIWTQLARYLVVYLNGDFTLTSNLPFFMCRLSILVLLYYTITKDKRVESFLFYWGGLGLAGVIYPNGPFDNIANLTETFYIDHYLLTMSPFFMVAVEKYVPSKKDLFIITGLMFAILVLFVPINSWMGSDYFYLADQSIFASFLPGAPTIVFIVAHTLAAFGWFSLYYWVYKDYKIINVRMIES